MSGQPTALEPTRPLPPRQLRLRLRDLLGVSTRAEIVRFLVTSRARDATVLTVAEAASYAKRNVAAAQLDELRGVLALGRRRDLNPGCTGCVTQVSE